MAKNVYPISINVNLLKPNKEFYTLNTDQPIASNVFLANYQMISCEQKSEILVDKTRNIVFNDFAVAVKCFKLENLTKTEFELAIHEAKVLRQLKHKNIQPLLANFVNDNQIWMVMPVAEYGSCYQLSRPHGLPELLIALILRDVLQGLDYLHSQGIIHRGIRSSRILIESNGRCILSGLQHSTSCIHNGKWLNVVHDYPPTAKDNINWYAPEVLEQNLCGYNFKSDIYSIGILICELGNGTVPFESLSPTELLLDKLTGYIPRLLDKTCEELKALDLEKMDRQNKDRFQTYKSRRFSDNFHHLLLECCLVSDTNRRYSAKSLLGHKFFKQIKKSSNILNLLPSKTSSLLEIKPINPHLELDQQFSNDLCVQKSRCLNCEHCKYSGFIDNKYIQSDICDEKLFVKWNF